MTTDDVDRWTRDLGFDRASVHDLLDDVPDGNALRPALKKLTDDQRELIASFVDGFADRRAFLEWCQDAGIQTLGALGADWCKERAFSGVDLSMLVTDPHLREGWSPDGAELLSQAAAADARRVVVVVDLLPACVDAVRGFRWSAVEYDTEDDGPVPDADSQQHPAMRPALSELDNRQEWALDKLLDGFESADAITAWYQEANEASYAEIDSSLAKELHNRRTVREFLLDRDADDAARFREALAAEYLLPAFVTAIEEVAQRAGEQNDPESTKDHSPLDYS